MAATVQLLLRTASPSAPTKTGKPSIDDAGDDFKRELDRASDAQSEKPQETGKPKKAEDSAPAKKTHAKGKAAKNKDGDKPADDATTDAADDSAVTGPGKAKTSGDDAQSPTDETTVVEEVPEDQKPVVVKEAAEKSVDASALALAAAVQGQPVAKAAKPESHDTSDASDAHTEQVAKTEESTDATAAAVAQAIPAASKETDESVDATETDAEQPAEAAGVQKDALPLVAALGDDTPVGESQPAVSAKKATATTAATDATADPVAAIAQYFEALANVPDAKPKTEKPTSDVTDVTATAPSVAAKTLSPTAGAAKPDQAHLPPETRFAEANHTEIVRSVQAQLMPRGGTMQMRLDPPELGALQVMLTISKDGVATASFQTSNDDATRLLSHSLSQLKTALEASGVTVDKLQVQQSPRETHTNAGEDQHRGQGGQEDFARQQEQQRKEVIKRMWRKLSGQSDPLDLVA